MRKLFTNLLALCAVTFGVMENVGAATPTLSSTYSVAGYVTSSYYDFTTNVSEILPTEGDLKYRESFGLHNFGGGSRSASTNIKVEIGNIVILEGYITDPSKADLNVIAITGATTNTSITTDTYKAFDISTESETITITVSRGSGIRAALVLKKDENVKTADYTLKYTDGTNEIKNDTKSGVVNEVATISESDRTSFITADKKYIYVSDDSEGKTIAEDGSTVVTLTFREAASYAYTVKNSFDTELASGSVFEGESVSVTYPSFVLKDGVLYATAQQATNPWWGKTFVITEDNQTETISYTEAETDVVYYSEAEDIEGATVTAAANADVRCSNGKGAKFESDVVITKLAKGKYKVTAAVWGGKGATYTINIGDESALAVATTGSIATGTSDEIEVAEDDTEVTILTAGDNNKVLDYVYIVKTGEYEEQSAPTAISTPAVATPADGQVYTLGGVKVKNPTQGIYVQNGKLIVIK